MRSFPAAKGIMRSSPSHGQPARGSSVSAENSSSRFLSMFQLMQYERELRENFSNPIGKDDPPEVIYRNCEDAIDHASWRSTGESKATTFADLLGRADLIKLAAESKPMKARRLKRFGAADDDETVDTARSAAEDQSYPPIFSYDGDESFKSSSEGKGLFKSIEAPNYSFDSRESPRSVTNANTSLRSSSSSCNTCPGTHLSRLLLDTSKQLPMQIDIHQTENEKSSECKKNSPNVVARLMGLEDMPEQMLHHCHKAKACTEEAEVLEDETGQSSSSQADHSYHESYGGVLPQQRKAGFWQHKRSDQPNPASAAADLRLLTSDHILDPNNFHGKVGFRPALPLRYSLDGMPTNLKQNNDLISPSECRSTTVSQRTKYTEGKNRNEVEEFIHRPQEFASNSLWQSPPAKRQGSPKKCPDLIIEATARQSQLVKGIPELKHVDDSGQESETGIRLESQCKKFVQKDVLSSPPIHSPKSGKTKMESSVTGKISGRAPKVSTDHFISTPAKIVVSSPSICHNKGSAKGEGRAENLRSKRSPNKGQNLRSSPGINLKASHHKKVDQSKDSQEHAQMQQSTQERRSKKKVIVRASPMMCSKSSGLQPTATKVSFDPRTELSCRISNPVRSPCLSPKVRHSVQSSPEKKKKLPFSKRSHENEAKTIMELKDKDSETGSLHQLDFHPKRQISGADKEIAKHQSINEPENPRENISLEEASDAQFKTPKEIRQVKSRFAAANGLNEMPKGPDEKKSLEGDEVGILHWPVNNQQEMEEYARKTKTPGLGAAEGDKLHQRHILHRHINEQVRGFEQIECFEMESAAAPDSPSSMNCEPDRHDFIENGFGEAPELPSPLSVLDASLLLDAPSPDLYNHTPNLKMAELEMGDGTLSEVMERMQVQKQVVKCRSLFGLDQSLEHAPPNRSLNPKEKVASHGESAVPALALYAKSVGFDRSVFSKEEQFQCICKILGAAEHADKVDAFTDFSSSKYFADIIDKNLDCSINQRVSDGETWHELASKTDPSTINRRILLDCIAEIVETKLLPHAGWTVLSKDKRRRILLRLINHELQQLFSQPLQDPSRALPAMLEAALSRDWHHFSLESETSDLVNCVENLIFKQLVDESLLELIVLSQKVS